LKPDEGEEKPDSSGGADSDGLGDEFGEFGAKTDCGDEEEDDSFDEDCGQSALVGDVAGAVEADDGVGEVGVGAHAGGEAEREVGEGAHDEAANERRGYSGDDQVLARVFEARSVTRVNRVELAWVVGVEDAEGRGVAGRERDGGVGAEG